MKIANAPERDWPLRVVLKNLASAGVRGRMELRVVGDTITFDHHSVLLVLDKP
jgi:hypothetical protein